MKPIRAIWRLIKFLNLTSWYFFTLLLMETFKKPSKKRRDTRKMLWGKALIQNLGIKVHFEGTIPTSGVMVAPNHRSYIDIALIVSLAPVSFLAKKELSKWPVIGPGTILIDSFFVDRSSKESRSESRAKIGRALKEGHVGCVYPEGTTFKGPGVKEFKPGIFATCAKYEVPVVPVAIEYDEQDVAWVDDDTFFPHFLKIFGRKEIHVSVHVGPHQRGTDVDKLMANTHDWIDQETREMRKAFDSGKK